jgi:hypothetical protein
LNGKYRLKITHCSAEAITFFRKLEINGKSVASLTEVASFSDSAG